MVKLNYDQPIVIETHHKKSIEWGVSFNGFNPDINHYIEMISKESAFKLIDFLTKRTPISLYRPIS